MRVVIDTNILLQAIAHGSRLRPIWTAFLNEAFTLHLTSAILLEYEELLAQKTSEAVAKSIISLLSKAPNAHLTTIYYRWNVIKNDPDDNKFFDAAIAANADYLVTNDTHFNQVKNLPFPKVTIVSSDEFLQVLSEVI
jgi:putative PIN family toxin of toxin-antitoxin system